jgi:hypothetical protein
VRWLAYAYGSQVGKSGLVSREPGSRGTDRFFFSSFCLVMESGYKKNKMSTDMESRRGNKRARVTRGSRNPKHGKRKGLHCAQT